MSVATGDVAASAGLRVVPPTEDARMGYDAINARGDELAEHLLNGGHDVSKITGLSGALAAKQPAGEYAGRTIAGQAISVRAEPPQRLIVMLDGAEWGVPSETAVTTAIASAVSGIDGSHADGPSLGSYGRTAGSNRYAVWMDDSLLFGRNTSARKYKEDEQPSTITAADVLALQPVTYHRLIDPDGEREFGLIADDVEKVLPEVCTYYDGQIDGIRYDLLAVALLTVVKDQQAQLDALTARVGALEVPPVQDSTPEVSE